VTWETKGKVDTEGEARYTNENVDIDTQRIFMKRQRQTVKALL
jgi:hypothetical protein